MNSTFRFAAAVLALLSVLFCATGLAADESRSLVVNYLVVDEKVRPFQIVDHGESRGGIVTDIVHEIFAGSVYQVNSMVLPVNRIGHSVREGLVENWIAFDSPVWDSFGEYGEMLPDPLFTTHHIILTCSDSLREPVSSVADLSGLALVTLSNFKYLALDDAASKGVFSSLPVDRFDAGFALVGLGRADGFVEMAARLRYNLEAYRGDKGCMREVSISSVIPDYQVHLSIARELPEEVAQLVRQRLSEMAKSGRLRQIYDLYAPAPGKPSVPLVQPVPAGQETATRAEA